MSGCARMRPHDSFTNPVDGDVRWSWRKSAWYLGWSGAALVLAPLTFSWSAAVVSCGFTVATLCLGHTLGMHRRLIHQSYECPAWVEAVLVYLGTLVGLGGPFRVMYLHDIRDWSQRHPDCHAFFRHSNPWWIDFWQQQNCEITLRHPPRFIIEDRVRLNRFYAWLDRTWRWQQLPPALALYLVGGWRWVVWGMAVRLFFSLTGHWLVGFLAHNHGGRHWHIEGAAVQGYNVAGFALLTMGESWHNNHHAYPESSRLGLKAGEWDLGWWVLRLLERLGLARNLRVPETLPARPERRDIGATKAF
jgi:fatty-acid desaturase